MIFHLLFFNSQQSTLLCSLDPLKLLLDYDSNLMICRSLFASSNALLEWHTHEARVLIWGHESRILVDHVGGLGTFCYFIDGISIVFR